jgi:uncharacterized protein YlxW (UPF0749 family)
MKGWRAALTPTGVWRVIVPGVCLVAGLLFATSHEVAQGHELRSPATADLADLVRNAERQVDTESATLRQLQAEAKAATDAAAADDTQVGRLKTEEGPLLVAAGREAVSGPGILVVLDDAPTVPDDPTVDPNQLVVHQSDLQAVVNALWAGGADAVSVAGQRLIATSAVRCVGNTLLLNGRVYSPPYQIEAIGLADAMSKELGRSPGVTLYRQAASYYGLGYTVESQQRLDLPAYDGPLALDYAKAG